MVKITLVTKPNKTRPIVNLGAPTDNDPHAGPAGVRCVFFPAHVRAGRAHARLGPRGRPPRNRPPRARLSACQPCRAEPRKTPKPCRPASASPRPAVHPLERPSRLLPRHAAQVRYEPTEKHKTCHVNTEIHCIFFQKKSKHIARGFSIPRTVPDRRFPLMVSTTPIFPSTSDDEDDASVNGKYLCGVGC